MVKRGKKSGLYSNAGPKKFDHNSSYYCSSQGLQEINGKIDELMSFPSQDFGNFAGKNTGPMQNFSSDRSTQDPVSQSKLDRILSHVESLNNKFNGLSYEIGSVKKQLNEALTEIRELKAKNQKLEKELYDLKSAPVTGAGSPMRSMPAIDRIQREVRQKCLLISGPSLKIPQVPTPRSLAESASDALKRAADVDLNLDCIDNCRRFGNDIQKPQILLTLSSVFMKEELLSKYITNLTRDRNEASEQPNNANNQPNNANQLFVNEFLCQEQAHIFYCMRQLKKSADFKDLIYSVFTRRGITAYKPKAESKPIFVNSMDDVEDVKVELQNLRQQSTLRRSTRTKPNNYGQSF